MLSTVLLIIGGIILLILAIRFGFVGLLLQILVTVLSGGRSGGGGKSGGSGFGGGRSGGGGSSSSW